MAAISSRRLLLHYGVAELHSGTGETSTSSSTFNANVVMILAVLLCAVISALGLSAFIRFALRLCGRPDPSFPAVLPGATSRWKSIRKLPVQLYSADLKLSGSSLECVICVSEIQSGERIRRLPNCGHGFHVRCIDRWIQTRPTCPTCRQCLFASSPKISSCAKPEVAAQPVIEVLEPEGFEIGYRV